MRSSFTFAVAATAVTGAHAQILEINIDQDFTAQIPLSNNNNLNVGDYTSVNLGNAAINAPYDKCESYIGHTVYRDCKPFNIKDCEEPTRYNQQTGGRGICTGFVNTYVLVKSEEGIS